jgi:hypothetical protein
MFHLITLLVACRRDPPQSRQTFLASPRALKQIGAILHLSHCSVPCQRLGHVDEALVARRQRNAVYGKRLSPPDRHPKSVDPTRGEIADWYTGIRLLSSDDGYPALAPVVEKNHYGLAQRLGVEVWDRYACLDAEIANVGGIGLKLDYPQAVLLAAAVPGLLGVSPSPQLGLPVAAILDVTCLLVMIFHQ